MICTYIIYYFLIYYFFFSDTYYKSINFLIRKFILLREEYFTLKNRNQILQEPEVELELAGLARAKLVSWHSKLAQLVSW